MALEWHFFSRRVCASAAMAVLLLGLTDSALARKAKRVSSDTSAPAMEQIHNFTHKATELAMTAMTLVGTNYKYGGSSPETGIDCSGLVRYVFKEAWGTTLPRTSAELSKVGQEVSKDELQPGDLVFYNTRRRSYSHVGIYLGDNKFIHAPSSGKTVRIDNMDQDYWKARFNGARRVKNPDEKTRFSSTRRITNPDEQEQFNSDRDRILQILQNDIRE